MEWSSTTYVGARQLGTSERVPWAEPLFEAFCSGAWITHWTADTLYWVAKPIVRGETVSGWRRAHCETGPAIVSDVEDLYLWHGILVPEYVVMRPQEITGTLVIEEPNAEVRAVMIQRRPQALADMPGAVVLDEDSLALASIFDAPGVTPRMRAEVEAYAASHPRPSVMRRRLLQVPMPDHEDGFVKVMVVEDPAENGVPTALLAYPEVTTCQEAVARSYGLTVKEYPAEHEARRR